MLPVTSSPAWDLFRTAEVLDSTAAVASLGAGCGARREDQGDSPAVRQLIAADIVRRRDQRETRRS